MAMTRSGRTLLRRTAHLAFIFVLLLLPAYAQFDTGTISGSVLDPSGAVVPNASVTITNTGTGNQQTYKADSSGYFVASALPFGTYVVTADSSGFSQAKSQPIALTVGANVNVRLALAVSASSQTVEVTGTSTTVDTTTSTAGTTLNSRQVEDLPINGRDVNNFLNVAPGSVNSTGFFQGSVNGLENIFTGLNVTVDGQTATRGDINGFLQTEGQEAARITRASVESIQEINFNNSGYTAETGHSLGPQMNIVTKGGTNSFHGTVFEFLRNDALDARDFFETGAQRQPLKLNQFGGNLAGPIIKNKLFFFANYEGDRTHITRLAPLNETLSAAARAQLPAALAPLRNALPALPANCNTVATSAACPGLNANLIFLPAALPDILREDTGSIRLDYNVSNSDRLMFRYNLNDSDTQHTFGINAGQVSPQTLRTQLAKIEETHSFSPSLLNQFGVAVNRFRSDTNSNTGEPLVGFSGFFTDLGSLPGPNTFNQVNANTLFEVTDGLTKITGAHSLRFGADIRVNRLNTSLRPQQTYSYASFNDLFTNTPFVLQKIGFPGTLGLRNSNWGFYFQDNWKATRRLTLNLGLRYDYNTVWSEAHDNQQNFDPVAQAFLPAKQAAYSAPKNDFAPRVGFSYDVFGNGKTAIHGYGGFFYMPMQFSLGLATNIPQFSNYNVNIFDALFGNPPFSISFPSPNPPVQLQNVTAFPRNPKDPYSENWLFGVEQELAPNTVLTINYTGNKTQHMQSGIAFAAIQLNPANTVTGARPFSKFASENFAGDVLGSKYNAMQVQVRRHAGRLTLEGNYTWSHESDDLVNVFSSFSNPFNPKEDWSTGDIDVRHNFTAHMVYDLPDLKGRNSVVRGVLGGWQTSSIIQTRSGLPVNVTLISGFFGDPRRPNLIPGQQLISKIDWPNQSYNGGAFSVPAGFDGSFGSNPTSIGRNFLRGPAFFQWDFSAAKNFSLTERTRLQFRGDLFNILNHPNFANPDGGICTAVSPASGSTPAGCLRNPNFGRVGQTVADASGGLIGNGTARQAQLSLRLSF